ncbi:MAG: hypothetical protein M1391_13545 [Bacteroidetes bacterium]|nr:hypothetical protein [Bacteroidota bacterium]
MKHKFFILNFWVALLALIVTSNSLFAQSGTIAHFSIWKSKPGQEDNFETGYKQHLKWHVANGDKWNWVGWYVISGPKTGLFIDATFDHSWGDFDKPIKHSEDLTDVGLHVSPFGDYQSAFKVSFQPDLSISDSSSLKSKLLRLVILNVTDIEAGKKIIAKLKTSYQSAGTKTFLTFKIVDGGNLNQLLLFLGFNNFEEYGRSENVQEDLLTIENSLNTNVITSITSETLVYNAAMSYFPYLSK